MPVTSKLALEFLNFVVEAFSECCILKESHSSGFPKVLMSKLRNCNDRTDYCIAGTNVMTVKTSVSPRLHNIYYLLQVVPHSGDIIMVDATSSLDRQDSKLMRFITGGPAGGLPVATIILSSETRSLLTDAFLLLRSMLPSFAFNGRGPTAGPVIFMTDDAEGQVAALR